MARNSRQLANSRCICGGCGIELVVGRDPAVIGCCVRCNQREVGRLKRQRSRNARERRDRPAQTKAELEAAGDPFRRLRLDADPLIWEDWL